MSTNRVSFPNADQFQLAGVLEQPAADVHAYAVFAHCFTCSKDLKAIVRVSRNLAKQGIAVLRFDLAGIGDSQGGFADSNFETNVADLNSAIEWLASTYQPPALLIGHSLGGAAAMALAAGASNANGAASQLSALVTLAAPSDTHHLAEYLVSQNYEIETTGAGEVTIGGRPWMITRQLIESLRQRNLTAELPQIKLPHLVLHSPTDQTVAFGHAHTLLEKSGGATSLVTIDGADHLLVNQKNDVAFVADVIATWSKRYCRPEG